MLGGGAADVPASAPRRRGYGVEGIGRSPRGLPKQKLRPFMSGASVQGIRVGEFGGPRGEEGGS